MKKKYTSQNRMFLLELILCVILFTILLAISLRFFAKSHAISQESTDLYHASILCASIADECKLATEDLSVLSEWYNHSNSIGGQQIIYFDQNYNECTSSDYSYRAIVTAHANPTDAKVTNLTISFCNKTTEIYRIETCYYSPDSPAKSYMQNEACGGTFTLAGGDIHE